MAELPLQFPLPSLLPSPQTAIKLGTICINSQMINVIASEHSVLRMNQRKKATGAETIISAITSLGEKLFSYEKEDTVMVNVLNRGMSFILGFRCSGSVQIVTVINRSDATASPDTHLEAVSL